MARFINLTGGHDLNVYRLEDVTGDRHLEVKEGAVPFRTYPCEGTVTVKSGIASCIEVDGVTVKTGCFKSIEGIPEVLEEDAFYVVSGKSLPAIKALRPEIAHKFVRVDGVVFKDGRPCGCLGFISD